MQYQILLQQYLNRLREHFVSEVGQFIPFTQMQEMLIHITKWARSSDDIATELKKHINGLAQIGLGLQVDITEDALLILQKLLLRHFNFALEKFLQLFVNEPGKSLQTNLEKLSCWIEQCDADYQRLLATTVFQQALGEVINRQLSRTS